MSRLTVWNATEARVETTTEDAAQIARILSDIGVRFERWDVAPLPAGAEPDVVLAAYRPQLDAFMAGSAGGMSGSAEGLAGATAGSSDVIRLTPDHPMKDALRQKFLDEHIHTEDEIRFFHEGSGNFVIHADGRVFDAHCTAGDLISVPANHKHWFDAGQAPNFTALRVFTDTSGWVPHYTGTDMAKRFPAAT